MTALILVDVQNDFFPGGALAVPQGDEIIPVINQLLENKFDCVIASKDWHPSDHDSFASNHPGKKVGEWIEDQILWPDHCVQETEGAEFASGWDTSLVDEVILKGTDKTVDSYSAFFDNKRLRSTGLADYLKEHKIKELYVVGLATDYCVKYTVLDALSLGFKVHLILEGCRGIDLHEGDIQKSIDEMEKAGATLTQLPLKTRSV